jgi:nitroreductase
VTIPTRTELLPTLLADFDGTGRGGAAPAAVPARHAGTGWPLPAPSPAVRPVGHAIAGRRAERCYADRPVSGADLHAICAEAGAAAPGVEVYAVTTRVDGVSAGIHRYRTAGALVPAGTPDQAALRRIVLQEEFSLAPVILVVTGDLAAAVGRYGSHGYRRLLTAGGIAGQAAWIAAERRGLVGCLFAGVRAGELADHTDIDGYRRAFVVALALGHPQWTR